MKLQQGVTSTNALIKVVDWYVENVLNDLQAAPGSINPILQVDAIRYLYIFRYQVCVQNTDFPPDTSDHSAPQLTKEQLLQILPLLIVHLQSPNYVCYSYAAITVERILFMKQESKLL